MRVNYLVPFAILLVGHSYCLPTAAVQSVPLLASKDRLIQIDDSADSLATTMSTVGDEDILSSDEASSEIARPLQRRQSLLSSLGLGGPTTINSPDDGTQEFSPDFVAPKFSLISLKKRDSEQGHQLSSHKASGKTASPLQRRQSLLSSLGLGGPTTINRPVHRNQDFSPDVTAPDFSLISLKKRDSEQGHQLSYHKASGKTARPLQRRQSLLSSLDLDGPTAINRPVHRN